MLTKLLSTWLKRHCSWNKRRAYLVPAGNTPGARNHLLAAALLGACGAANGSIKGHLAADCLFHSESDKYVNTFLINQFHQKYFKKKYSLEDDKQSSVKIFLQKFLIMEIMTKMSDQLWALGMDRLISSEQLELVQAPLSAAVVFASHRLQQLITLTKIERQSTQHTRMSSIKIGNSFFPRLIKEKSQSLTIMFSLLSNRTSQRVLTH